MLEGGIQTGEITEAVTDRRVSCDVLLLNTIVAVVTAMKKNVVFIDTSNRLDASLLAAMLASQPGVDVESALNRVRVVKCFDVLELFSKLSTLCEALSQSNDSFYSSVKLVVIDGIADCIVPSLSHIVSNSGCGYISQLVRKLRQLATDFCCAVFLCNSNVNTVTLKTTTVPKQTAIGRLWCSVADTRLDVMDITAQNNEQSATDNGEVSGRIKVTLSKSNRLAVGQCVELEVNKHGLFI